MYVTVLSLRFELDSYSIFFFRAISESLLTLKKKISSEVMRAVTLPDLDTQPSLGAGCEYCEVRNTNQVHS